MKIFLKLFLLLLVVFHFQSARAQETNVPFYVKVLDENGQPVIGASVKFVHSPMRGPTGNDGRVRLTLSNYEDSLIVSHPGYQTFSNKVDTASRMPFVVHLSPLVTALREVVVSTG